MDRNTFKWSTVAALLASAAFVGPAFAQTEEKKEPETVPTTQTQPQTAPAASTSDSGIVVTGSRLRRTEFTSSSPVQIITRETATLEGLVDTSEIVQGSALATGTFQTNNQFTGFIAQGGPGGNQVSLRGLGSQRTLVLLNGRRIGPAGVRGTVQAVDLNTIPSAIVDRVEVLTDGASSIYGSEALGGVINLITRSGLDRIEANLQGTLPEESGGENYAIDAAWGTVFDRGYANLSAQFSKVEPLLASEREYTACAEDYLFTADRSAKVEYLDSVTGQAKCYGLFTNVLRTGFGDLIAAQPGVTYPGATQGQNSPVAGWIRQARAGFPATFPYANFQHPLYDTLSVLSPREVTSVYGTAGFDLTSNIEVYGEVLYTRRTSNQDGVRQFFPSVNRLNPGAVRSDNGQPYPTAPLPIIPLPSLSSQEVDYGRVLVGVKGDLSGFLDSWAWDLVAQYSKSDASYSGNFIYNDRVVATTGALGCNAAATNISNFNCANLTAGLIPWTSARIVAGQFNDNERAFLFSEETGTTTYTHQYVEGTLTGDLFKLPAGALSAAFGFQVRTEELDDTPGFNQRNNNLWGSTSAGRTAGEDTVREAFAEFEVPVLGGVPLVEDLTLNVSGRVSDYDSYGQSETYKVGLNWQIVPWLRMRASRGTSFRAPALFELFLANQTSFLGQASIDPCINWQDSTNPRIQANCAAAGVPAGYTAAGSSSALIIAGGGAGILDAETGESETIGIIWSPDFINLSVAVDYWEILVENQVAQFGAASIAGACYASTNFASDEFCTLLTRAPATDPLRANQILEVRNNFVNVASQSGRGVDLNIRYTHDASIGRFVADGRFYWTFEDETKLFGQSAVRDFLGTTYSFRGPDFTGEFNLRYDRQDWTVQWSMDFVGKGSDTEEYGGDVFNSTRYATNCRLTTGVVASCTSLVDAAGNLPAGATVVGVPVYFKQYNEFTSYHDLTVRKRFDDWSVSVGLLNVFDEHPPAASTGQTRFGTAARGNYDLVGRRAYLGLSKRW